MVERASLEVALARDEAPTDMDLVARFVNNGLLPAVGAESSVDVVEGESPLELSVGEGEALELAAKKVAQLKQENAELEAELKMQIDLRKVVQKTLDVEQERSGRFGREIIELQQVSEQRLLGHRQMSDAEAMEMGSQVEALLLVKQQLFTRVEHLEAERGTLLRERDHANRERACVVCMDRFANTVLFSCRHMVCCEACAKRVSHCPVCRQAVLERLVVFTV